MNLAGLAKAAALLVVCMAVAEPAPAQSGGGAAAARSPAPKPPLPVGKLLQSAPEFSSWTIDFSYPQDRQQAQNGAKPHLNPDLPRKIITTRTKDITHEETITTGGKKLENWQQKGNLYTKFPGKNFWSAYEKPSDYQMAIGTAVFKAAPESGFRDLDWINKDTYAGSLQNKQSLYLIFVPSGASSGIDTSDIKTLRGQPKIAYIDDTTRLPISVTDDFVVRTYTFSPSPPAMQTMPPDLVSEIKTGDEIRAKAAAQPKLEY